MIVFVGVSPFIRIHWLFQRYINSQMAKLNAKYKLILKTSVLILIKIQFIDIPVCICQSVKSMIKCSSSTKALFSVPHEYYTLYIVQCIRTLYSVYALYNESDQANTTNSFPSFISIAVLKHCDKKQSRVERVYFNSQFWVRIIIVGKPRSKWLELKTAPTTYPHSMTERTECIHIPCS